MDHWNIEGYEGPSEYRTEVLKGMKDQLIRSEVVMGYTVLDEFLTNMICDYYFRRKKGQVSSYRTLWKTKPFKVFVHHLMDETYLLKKMAIVHTSKQSQATYQVRCTVSMMCATPLPTASFQSIAVDTWQTKR